MHSDTKIWIAILMMAVYIGNVNIRVIHRNYQLTPMHQLNMYMHQLAGLTMSLGVLFTTTALVELHLALLLMTIACFMWYKGCFLAIWERDNIPYTPSDLEVIQRPEHKRASEFFMLLLPFVFVDIYKLSMT